jgi:hypothetical protein
MKDPFPEAIPKNKAFKPENMMVRLLSNASTNFTQFGPVKATVISEGHGAMKNAKEKAIEGDVQAMDVQTRCASFPLKFLAGTRMSCVSLKFSMQATAALHGNRSIPANLETPNSRPYIVITNESQWEQAEQLLFKLDAFGKSVRLERPRTFLPILTSRPHSSKSRGLNFATRCNDTSCERHAKTQADQGERYL